MRLRTKLVLTATGLTFAIVFVVSLLFLAQEVRQRIEQTSDANDMLTHEVLQTTKDAIYTGLQKHPAVLTTPSENMDDALHAAVLDTLRSADPLNQLMTSVVRYSKTVQDVSVTDAHGYTLLSTDEDMLNQPAPYRASFAALRDGSLYYQLRELFGRPRLLDVSLPLDRNNQPFLVIHIGVRSTFLRNAYTPWLRAALWMSLIAVLISMVAAALLSAVALRPVMTIGEQLEALTLPPGDIPPERRLLPEAQSDPVGRVNLTIDRLGREMRSREEGYTVLQANLAHVLDTLRDGVLLFTAERRAVMVSDAVEHFVDQETVSSGQPLVGMRLEEMFPADTALGAAVLAAFNNGENVSGETVQLEDGREVQISLDRIEDGLTNGPRSQRAREMGTLLTLRDTASALELEQELEVSRRLASIGRLTANVGHEVKNPINAMVVHLELLKAKLSAGLGDPESARKHVDILADEMHRLDRVVQTLADFSRPISLDLRDQDLRSIVGRVLDLAGAELKQHHVVLETVLPPQPVQVRVDGELIRQALLNLVLNAMQAMPDGGTLRVRVERQGRLAVVEVADTGTGIPDSVLPRIFDLYFTTKSTGSGIGLAMTYRIMQLHGGALDVRSNAEADSPDRGTVFTVRIPVSVQPGSEVRKPSPKIGDTAEPALISARGEIAANIGTKESR